MECAARRKPDVRAIEPHMSRNMPRYLPRLCLSSRGSRLARGVIARLPIELGGGHGGGVELVGRQAPVAKAQHAVCHLGDGGVVRHDHDGAAVLPVHALHEFKHFFRGLVIEGARRLVAQDEARVLHERAADGAALLLAAGDLAGELVAVLPEAERAQEVLHGQRVLGEVRGDLDVLLDGEVWHEVIELEDEAKLATAVLAEVSGREGREVAAVDGDASAVCALEAADEVQEGRLARAGGAEHDADLAAVHGAGDAVEYLDAGLPGAVVLLESVYHQVRGVALHGTLQSSREG